jgi:hypothetical protein
MASALTSPFAVAALVLCVAGVAKLRAPRAAAAAVGAHAGQVRAFALAELALGIWALSAPAPLPAVLVSGTYAGFSGLSLWLAHRRSACGCFGQPELPASAGQSALSAALAAVAAAAATWPPHDAHWLASHPVIALGIAAAAYATVLAYTALPVAWSAWAGGSR